MESTKKVSESTELLTKAFSLIHDEIFAQTNYTEESKAIDISEPICLALESMDDFGSQNSKRVVFLVDKINEKFKDSHLKTEINDLCRDILNITVSANRFVYTYSKILSVIQNDIKA